MILHLITLFTLTVNDKIKYNPSIKDVHDKLYKDFLNDPIGVFPNI